MQRLYAHEVGNDDSGHMHDQWKIPPEISSHRIPREVLRQSEKIQECCRIWSNDNIE